ncbi:MAG: ABC transporter permease [Saccharofermentanales bacterium]
MFWKKFYLDFVLFALAVYGYYNFISRQRALKANNLSADQIPVDPLIFLILIIFIVSMGLVFLRFYPMLMTLISTIKNNTWSASFYSSIKRVSYLKEKEQFLILFIIMTMSLGIFSANSARTINSNLNDNIMYTGGADIVIIPYEKESDNRFNKKSTDLVEKPIYSSYKNLTGVTAASIISIAKEPEIYVNLNQSGDSLKMIGVDPKTYSDVIWSRTDMLDLHINNYLNLLQENPDNCIISKNLADEMGLSIGDRIDVNNNSKGFGEYSLNVKAIVDNWPAYIYTKNEEGVLTLDQLIITNNVTLENKFKDISYQVLLKTDSNATAESISNQLSDSFLPVAIIHDYKADIINSENSAQRQSFNSLLTFSFIIIFTICFMGFILYWIFSIKSRILQFGILRAMGMSVKAVYSMLAYEQILLSLITTAYSVVIGGVASRIFVNILQIMFNAGQQVLPFKFMSSQVDFAKIYIFFGLLFVLTFIILIILIKKIKIAQTIKLGED